MPPAEAGGFTQRLDAGETQGQGGMTAFQCPPSSPLTRTHALEWQQLQNVLAGGAHGSSSLNKGLETQKAATPWGSWAGGWLVVVVE